ncbi:MAG: PKD domain-containing protein [Candidatus Zixiibacteriota bacterium]
MGRTSGFLFLLVVSVTALSVSLFGYVRIETTVYGPAEYVRGEGDPETFVDTFYVFNPNGEFRLRVVNGESGGDKRIEDAVSSARVYLNGEEIVSPNDFNKTVSFVEVDSLTMFDTNIVEVWIASQPGSKLKIEFFGTDQDTVTPVVDIGSPIHGAKLSDDLPAFFAGYYDDWMGVDTSTFAAALDGQTMTELFIIGEDHADYQPAVGEELDEGNHHFEVSIADLLGNIDIDSSSFLVDVTTPDLSVDYPPDGQTITEATPNIQITYSDDLAGIDLSSLLVEINGTGFTSYFTVGDNGATYQTVTGDLNDGSNSITVSVLDSAGNQSTVTANFSIEQFRAIATAYPTSGYAPLTVVLEQAGVDPSSTIENYRWDFDGNGSWDTYDQVARQYSHTYHNSGTYSAVLRVMNTEGEYAYDTATIVVQPTPPTASANSIPSNGELPLNVNFYGSGSDADGYIVLHEWDFDGDGVYDWSSATAGNTTHTYTEAGTYSATYRVTDNAGLSATAPVILTEVRVGPPGSPTASAGANPTSGQAPLSVSFQGVATDPEGNIVLYEWDFDGDGAFDWSSATTGNISHTYDIPGLYYPAFRVTDGDGLVAVDYMGISVGLGVNLSIPDDTYNPYLGETATIRTSISAPIPVNVLIKTKEGDVVRNLVSNETRPAGTQDDVWDGTDDLGNMLPDGPYYAVLEYLLEGELIAYDLTNSTGGQRYLPSRQSIGYNHWIYPFADDFLDIHFYVPRASEITCFVGILWTQDRRIRTIFDRVPSPAGSRVIYWDGLDDAGDIAQAPSGNNLILGMWAYDLPDNAIFLTGGAPVITNVAASPNYISHFSEGCGGSGAVDVSYTLSEISDVSLRVIDASTSTVLHTHTEYNVPPGNNIVSWNGGGSENMAVDAGIYQIGIAATDGDGNQSMFMYTLLRATF